MAEEIHLYDIGTVFEVTLQEDDVDLDISAATLATIIFVKPDGEVVAQEAEFTTDGTDGKIQYTTIADDLDQTGKWRIQARVALPTGTWSSSRSSFKVYPNLD